MPGQTEVDAGATRYVVLGDDGKIDPAMYEQGGSSGQSLGIWLYGDGSDGPLKFTATPRTITDAVLVPGSDVITSATAGWTSADVGLVLDDTAGLGALAVGARIKSVTNPTDAVMTTNANTNGAG